MIEVKVRRGQSIEKAISIFKKKVKDSKILYELREREYYMKPSLIKKEKKAKANEIHFRIFTIHHKVYLKVK